VPALTGPSIDLDGTVLITGASGGLGIAVARHLVAAHGVRDLVLASRRGTAAPELAELAGELGHMGASVDVRACDVSDRDQAARLIDGITNLKAVVHTAAVLDDSTIEALTPEQIDRALRPKVDACLHLHELTEHIDLSAFVLFSSVAGRLSGIGQGSYAAANSFVDALALHRRSRGLPAVSLAWGLWADAAGMGGRLDATALRRTSEAGVSALSTEDGLALFDAALTSEEAVLLPVRLDMAVLREQAKQEVLPALLRGLVHTTTRRPAAGQAAPSLASASVEELVELVRTHVAAVLGYPGPESVSENRVFQELGFDSITAVQLRNRLNAATGLRLPATLVFDSPTPVAVARDIAGRLSGEQSEVDRIKAAIAAIPVDLIRAAGLLKPLLELADGQPAPSEAIESIDSMELDDLVQLALDGPES
jgi:NAD(P)-dependent dehydrogenase (short-subunit alcohol dehydrogenase family)